VVKPVFSEFSYGFALTHELVKRFRAAVAGAPTFPSLIEEGRAGGYDVGMPMQGWTIFLQFKVSQFMKRKTAMHWDEYRHPYYRFPIRPATYSGQHRFLLELADEASAHLVAYVAPAFHDIEMLNDHFLNERVADNSVWVPVHSIGEIRDNGEHWVIFDGVGDRPRLASDQHELLSVLTADAVTMLFTEGPIDTPTVVLDEQFFRRLSRTMVNIGREEVPRNMPELMESADYSPLATCAYLARTLYDSELLLAFAAT
jgi:hypothetical protein